MRTEHDEIIDAENKRRRELLYRTTGDVTHLTSVQNEARLKSINGTLMHVKQRRKRTDPAAEFCPENSIFQVIVRNEIVFEADGIARNAMVTSFLKGYCVAKEHAMITAVVVVRMVWNWITGK